MKLKYGKLISKVLATSSPLLRITLPKPAL